MATAIRLDVPDEHIRLMYDDGLSQRQIAEAVGLSQRTVCSRLKRMGARARHRGCKVRDEALGW